VPPMAAQQRRDVRRHAHTTEVASQVRAQLGELHLAEPAAKAYEVVVDLANSGSCCSGTGGQRRHNLTLVGVGDQALLPAAAADIPDPAVSNLDDGLLPPVARSSLRGAGPSCALATGFGCMAARLVCVDE